MLQRYLVGVLLTATALGLLFTPAPQAAEPQVGPSRAVATRSELSTAEQIAQIEKQIAELQAQLEALKKAPAPVTKTPELTPSLPVEWASALRWRCVGPASMGGRIVSIAVNPNDTSMFWVATASGGLLKTVNGGITFEHQFDREATVAIGDVAVAASNPKIVWVGTGENNPRNSVSWGDGVYKSEDGGVTWKNMGLKKSFQIGRVVIHPKNPDIVYVGALGRLYGPNEERGLYKTTDGGKNWTKILHVDNNTGVIEMKMHPTDAETLLVATWERRRDGFDSHAGAMVGRGGAGGGGGGGGSNANPPLADGYDAYDPVIKWGKGSGIYKTTDGGKSFKKMTAGLPSNPMGRIGLDYYLKDPKVVFAIIDCQKIGMGAVVGYLGVTSDDAPRGGGVVVNELTANSPAVQAGLKVGDRINAVDGKAVKDYESFTNLIRTKKPGDKAALDVVRGGKAEKVTVTLGYRPGDRPFRPEFMPVLPGSGNIKVESVTAGGGLEKAGLKVEDVITTIDKTAVTDFRQLMQEMSNLSPGQEYSLTVKRGKETVTLKATAPPAVRTNRPNVGQLGGQRENVQDSQGPEGFEYGGVYRSADGGETWKRINSINPRPMYFSQVRVDPNDEKRLYVLGIRLHISDDNGKTFRSAAFNVHDDMHAMWIDPRDSRHVVLGTDGGTYVSRDKCEKWDFLNTMAVGQFYHVAVDNRKPYRVYGGMQDNGSWGGPSRSLDGRGPVNSDWSMIRGGDGFVCRVDPYDPDIVYAESQDGNISRRNLKTGETASIRPSARTAGGSLRFNWNTPFILSQHNPSIVYCAGNYVFRSVDRGTTQKRISPELPKSGKASATALAESPRNADVLWAGTDDGQVWVTRDGGTKWENVTAKIGLPKEFCVATIEASRAADGRCYIAFDGHRSDSDDPHVYVTQDYGQTWKSLRANLPTGSSRCLREDLYNHEVLYLGTEFAVFASIDLGKSWTKINSNLPTVAVHELAQHPTAGEMAAATHGRSIWILDVTPFRSLKPSVVKEPASLVAPTTAIRWRTEPLRATIYGVGNREFTGDNGSSGSTLYYTLSKKPSKSSLVIQDITGKTVARAAQMNNNPGMYRAVWSMTDGGPITVINTTEGPGTGGGRGPGRRGGGGGGGGGGMGGFLRGGRGVPPGMYRVVLSVDDKEYVQTLKIENDPSLAPGTTIAEPEEQTRKPRRYED